MAALGSEPSWSTYTATGATTSDGAAAVWVTLGAYNKYSIWNSPHARLRNALASTWGQAGNLFFVSASHAETASTINPYSHAFPGSAASPNYVYCVNQTPGSIPPGTSDFATGATITDTFSSGQLTFYGVAYLYGLAAVAVAAGNFLLVGGNSGGASVSDIVWEAGSLQLADYVGSAGISLCGGNSAAQKVRLLNTTVSFGAVGQSMVVGNGGFLEWLDTTGAIQGTVPTTLFGTSGTLVARGVDLSAAGSGKTLFSPTSGDFLNATLIDCKLGSSVTVCATPGAGYYGGADVLRSDSSGTNYQQQRYRFQGTLLPETTIVRATGAQVAGTGVSWNIVTTANSKWVFPFEAPIMAVQNSTVGSGITATVYGIWKGAAIPNNDNIWIEVEYLGSSSSPLGSFITTTKANNLAAGTTTGVSADTSAWGAGAAAYQTGHAYGAFTGVILAGNASPQQLWFMATHSGTGTSGSDATIFNGKADGAQVTDNSGSNQIVWQAMTRFTMTTSSFTPEMAGQINIKVKAALASTTFYIDPSPVL